MEKFLGGKWRHGVGSVYVWSKYDHNNKTHKTTVQGAGGQFLLFGLDKSWKVEQKLLGKKLKW